MLHFHLLECYQEGSGLARGASILIKFSAVPTWMGWQGLGLGMMLTQMGVGQCGSSLLQNSQRGGITELGREMCVQREKFKMILFICGQNCSQPLCLMKLVLMRGVTAAAGLCTGSSPAAEL